MNWFRPDLPAILISSFLIISQNCLSWGFYGHRLINGKAIYSLPPEMFSFYKKNQSYLIEHSVDPDKRRYADKEEAPRHYIDLEHFLPGINCGLDCLDSLHLLGWKEAVAQWKEDSLKEYGILPWYLSLMVLRLEEAFKSGNTGAILKVSSEIGHYAADAHVPLHTTENYNGQLTGQKGIHALWESRIPERFGEKYEFMTGRAVYFEFIQGDIWKVIMESHDKVDFVLGSERELRNTFPSDKVYRPSTVGRKVSPQYTSAYVDAYAELNGNLVEEKMKAASYFTACLWYTAWVNAGQPDLSVLESPIEESVKKLRNDDSDHDH